MQGINTTPNMDPKLQESLKNAASQRTANAQGTTSNTLDKNPSFRKKVCTLGYLCTLREVYFKESVLYI